MRTRFAMILAMVVCLAGCGQSGRSPAAPVAPTAVLSSSPVFAGDVEVPFHSEVVWSKVDGSQVGLCTVPLPEGKVYLQRNTLSGTAVSTHLGEGTFLGHTCVYGTAERGPEGWLMDVSLTADNGDVLLADAEFAGWTGTPGQSVALEQVTFHDGGTGRFQFAEGSGTCSVNPADRTATYDATLRYGRKQK